MRDRSFLMLSTDPRACMGRPIPLLHRRVWARAPRVTESGSSALDEGSAPRTQSGSSALEGSCPALCVALEGSCSALCSALAGSCPAFRGSHLAAVCLPHPGPRLPLHGPVVGDGRCLPAHARSRPPRPSPEPASFGNNTVYRDVPCMSTDQCSRRPQQQRCCGAKPARLRRRSRRRQPLQRSRTLRGPLRGSTL